MERGIGPVSSGLRRNPATRSQLPQFGLLSPGARSISITTGHRMLLGARGLPYATVLPVGGTLRQPEGVVAKKFGVPNHLDSEDCLFKQLARGRRAGAEIPRKFSGKRIRRAPC
jgi:hypothetical protein